MAKSLCRNLTKRCSRCKKLLPHEDFYPKKTSSDGFTAYCRICTSARAKEYYQKNRKHILGVVKAYRHTESGRITSRRSAKKSGSSPTGIARRRRYYKKYPERSKARIAVFWAVKSGTLYRPTECSLCGEVGKIEAHHHKGYEPGFWLDVVWLCSICHCRVHRDVEATKSDASSTPAQIFD